MVTSTVPPGVGAFTLAPSAGDKYPLHAAVQRVGLDVAAPSPHALAALRNNVLRLRALRHALRAAQPDAIVSFTTTTNLMVVLAVTGWRVPVIVSERVFVAAHPPRAAWRLLYRMLCRRAAAVVAQTRRGADDLEARLQRPVEVIPVGKYAVKFKWNDGHEAGIYSWEFLRRVCSCEPCQAKLRASR